jgi:hypothetical protein
MIALAAAILAASIPPAAAQVNHNSNDTGGSSSHANDCPPGKKRALEHQLESMERTRDRIARQHGDTGSIDRAMDRAQKELAACH